MKNVLIAVIALVALALSGFAFAQNAGEPSLGAASGDTFTFPVSFLDGLSAKKFSTGGPIATLTDADGGTYTLTQATMANAGTLKFAAGGAGQAVVALALPATSTLTTLVKNAGDCRGWLYDASALAAATTTTVTAGTGHDLIAETTGDDVIDGARFGQITMCRQADGDVTTIVSELLDAD